jgi:hypothetical protein
VGLRVALPLLLILAAACGDDPPTQLVVEVATTGTVPDPDGYTLMIGEAGEIWSLPVGPNDTVRVDVPVEVYTALGTSDEVPPASVLVTLADVAPNCEVSTTGTVAIVREGEAKTLGFAVQCADTTVHSVAP